MTNERHVVDQIEYRWDPVRDMSPLASSLSPELTRGWDPHIRPWVRHPNVDAPAESVCYQALPADMVALAWRYADSIAAGGAAATNGRPLVSRVLVAPSSLLPPQVAMTLCRFGLPDQVGPKPGQVGAGAGLPPIGTGELARLAVARAAELDKDAAREEGLGQVVAAALSDLRIPLAIQLRDPDILQAPQAAPQGLLLWGLWRTVRPLIRNRTGARGWSFSTFELPMGNQDTSTLPDIVFRQAQASSGPPVNSRQEIRVRPGDPGTPAVHPRVTELAEWLVAEYGEVGGDLLEQLVVECAAGRHPDEQIPRLFEVLQARWGAKPAPGPATSSAAPPGTEAAPVPEGAAEHRDRVQGQERTGYGEADQVPDAAGDLHTARSQDAARHRQTAVYQDFPEDAGQPAREGASGDSSSRPPGATAPAPPVPDTRPASGVPSRPAEPGSQGAAGYRRRENPGPGSHHPQSVANLLRRLEKEPDKRKFQSVLDDLLAAQATFEERLAARTQMQRAGWCITAFERHGYQDYLPELAGIFQLLVLPDLDRASTASALRWWVRKGPPTVTAALLTASKTADERRRSGDGTFRLMADILGGASLQRLLESNGIPFDWPAAWRDADPRQHHSDRGFFARIFGSGA